MTSLFVSHSSVDSPVAERLATSLRNAGYAALFLDVDPDDGIPAGRNWERELYSALRRCDGVVYVASPASEASRWCFAELALAKSLSKPVFPVHVDGVSLPSLASHVQSVAFADGNGGFARLAAGLRRAGLDPDDAFAWDPARSPYPGLEAFAPEDAAVFFGRDAEIARLRELLEPTLARGAGRWVCVVGPSGSGKSSLVRAGLLPRLTRPPGRWLVLPPLIPGHRPTRALAACLARAASDYDVHGAVDARERALTAGSGGPAALRSEVERIGDAAGARSVLLVIDQLEELVTRTGPREGQAFVDLLRRALTDTSPLWVVATLRSEFLSGAPDHAELTEAIDDSLVVQPLGRSRLPEVIARPARRAGLEFEAGLVERLVDETAGGDALPLLAHTLRELAARADGGVVTVADYETLGGVVGALQRRADRLLDDLTRRGHGPLVVPTLLRLAGVDERGVPVRRRLPRAALSPAEQIVVDAFVDGHLLTTRSADDGNDDAGDPRPATVEVAHEALLRQWQPLRDDIERTSASMRIRTELGREAADWQSRSRDESYLLRGARLAAVDEWAADNPKDVEPLEREFLQASRAAAARRVDAVRRTNRRLRVLSSGLATLLVIALVAGGLALQQRSQAQTQAMLALTRQLLARAAQTREQQPDVSLLLTVAAGRRADESVRREVRSAFLDGLDRTFHVSTPLRGHTAAVNAVAFSPDGRVVATASDDGTVHLWDGSGNALGRLPTAGSEPVRAVSFSPDGRSLVTVDRSSVQLWDATSHTPRGAPLEGHAGPVARAVFTSDGTVLATAGADGTVRIWDVGTAQPRGAPFRGHQGLVFDLAFAPDGRTLTSVGVDSTARIWNVTTGETVAVLSGHTGPVTSGAVSADGALLATAGQDSTVRLWDLPDGRPRHELRGHAGPVSAIAISPDASVVASGGVDHTVRLWRAATGEALGPPLTGHTDTVFDLTFAGDGTVVSGANDGTVRIWDVRAGTQRGDPLAGHTGWINGVAVSPDGRTLASAGGDTTARLWQMAASTPLVRAAGEGSTAARAVAVGANVLAAVGDDGTVRAWDARTGAALATIPGSTGRANAVALGPDRTLAIGGDEGVVRVWDATSGRPVGDPLVAGAPVLDLAYSRDGAVLAAACADGVIRLWDVPSGRPRGTLSGHVGPVNAVAFGPDGRLASGGVDRTVRLWEIGTGGPEGDPLRANGAVLDVAFDLGGAVLASAGADAAIRLWDPRTRASRGAPITGFTTWVNGIAFSPDGATIASAADDGLRLWDVATGRPQTDLLADDNGGVKAVAFSPDGQLLASADAEATSVWTLDDKALTDMACLMANRDLTSAEWERFVGPETSQTGTCR